MSFLRRCRTFFTSNFESDSFAYVLFPFLRIFKFFGFAPFKLKDGEILRGRGACQPKFCVKSWIWSISDLILYFVGFVIGVYHLSETHNWVKLRSGTVIAYYTSWVQIVSIFVLGAVAVISSWTNLEGMQKLCKAIFQIDQLLKTLEGIKIDYEALRQRLFWEFIIGFLVPVSLSMVNCIIIQPAPDQFVLSTSCFWFICFAPIMLLTFKEFQFYNWLFILRMKFDVVNGKLKAFGSGQKRCSQRRANYKRVGTVDSVSQIPLTTMPSMDSNGDFENTTTPIGNNNFNVELTTFTEESSIAKLQKLLKIYSKLADAVELLLKIFSWHLVSLTTVSIAVIIIQCYNVFALLMDSIQMQAHQIFFVIAWILVQMTVIGVNVAICSKTAKTMSKTGSLLHKIRAPATGSDNDCVFYQTIQIFSMEVLQRKQIFTAAEFFEIDCKLITSIIASVTTYLVIIIQFHLNNVPGTGNIAKGSS